MSNDLQAVDFKEKWMVLIFGAPMILMIIFIFIMSSMSFDTVSNTSIPLDKVYHFFVFFTLSYSLYRYLCYHDFKIGTAFILAFVLSGVYGILDEIHQLYVPNRFYDINDIFADLIGSFCGVIVGSFIYRFDYRFSRKLVPNK